MRWRWVLVCASTAALALGQAALAQSATTDVEALVAEALDRSPMLQALDARVQAAGELVAPAGALPDPMVGLALREMGPPWAPMRDTTTWEVEASQALPWPGKRESRRQVARAEIAVREAEARQARQRVVRDVRAGIARLYALDQELAALDAAAEMLDLLAATARARYASGEAGETCAQCAADCGECPVIEDASAPDLQDVGFDQAEAATGRLDAEDDRSRDGSAEIDQAFAVETSIDSSDGRSIGSDDVARTEAVLDVAEEGGPPDEDGSPELDTAGGGCAVSTAATGRTPLVVLMALVGLLAVLRRRVPTLTEPKGRTHAGGAA